MGRAAETEHFSTIVLMRHINAEATSATLPGDMQAFITGSQAIQQALLDSFLDQEARRMIEYLISSTMLPVPLLKQHGCPSRPPVAAAFHIVAPVQSRITDCKALTMCATGWPPLCAPGNFVTAADSVCDASAAPTNQPAHKPPAVEGRHCRRSFSQPRTRNDIYFSVFHRLRNL